MLAAFLWGTAGPLSVALMRLGTGPESLALLRPLLGAVGLLLAALATTPYSTMAGTVLIAIAGMSGLLEFALPPSVQAWGLVVVFALTSLTFASFLFFDGLRHVTAPRAAIVTTLEPVVAAILAALFIGQGMNWVGWAGLSVVVGGVAGAYMIGPAQSADA